MMTTGGSVSMGYDFDIRARARANTIRLTARMAACLMAEAGVPDAAAIVGNMRQKGAVGTMDPDALFVNALVAEARYRTLIRLIERTGHRTVVDLPCGYTPRALHLTEKGMRYVGLDAPAVAKESGNILTFLAGHPERMEFHGVDAAGRDSLAAAITDVEGPICVATDGLLMYLTDREASAVIDNIRGLLTAHGGCWITSDPEHALQSTLTFKAVLGEGAAPGDRVAELTDAGGPANAFIVNPEDMEASLGIAIECLRRYDLKAKCVNLADHMPELISYRRMTKAQIAAFRAAMRYCHYWVITPDDGGKPRTRRKSSASTK